MSIVGEAFDGNWYGGFDDYFITRWGPDAQDDGAGEYWGVLVNNVFTNVGGCQYQLDGGDEVLWVYDAFTGRPRWRSIPADYAGGAAAADRQRRAGRAVRGRGRRLGRLQRGHSAGLAGAYRLRALRGRRSGAGRNRRRRGSRGSTRRARQRWKPSADGRARSASHEPGWHRIKATVAAARGKESAIRSNRLDVCVPDPPASDCGPLPAGRPGADAAATCQSRGSRKNRRNVPAAAEGSRDSAAQLARGLPGNGPAGSSAVPAPRSQPHRPRSGQGELARARPGAGIAEAGRSP